mmetsp:Transcript_31275/g.89726  ORF Transcript_31275/g.89726 Transcript_31275/m.89726 type:complete len:248 (-) Transcript_31275:27-770(-)
MITFLPLPDFSAVAQLLDDKRLGSQRVEARFILNCVRNANGKYNRFQNTGYVRMWLGYAEALAVYYNAIHAEWIRRGFNEGISKPEPGALGLAQHEVLQPGWLGDERLHSTHRAALLLKDPAHYGRHGWSETAGVQYLWPLRREDGGWDLVAPRSGESRPSARKRAEERARRGHWLSQARRPSGRRLRPSGRKDAVADHSHPRRVKKSRAIADGSLQTGSDFQQSNVAAHGRCFPRLSIEPTAVIEL